MAISKVLEFAKSGLKSLSGLDLDSGFPREEKPAREWFNYLFNLIFSMLNEIIDETNRLREDVDAINKRLDAAGTAPPVEEPDVPVTPPAKDLGMLKANSSHKGNVVTGNTLITQYVGEDVPNGTVIKFVQTILYNRTSDGGSKTYSQTREGSALVSNGSATYTFKVALPTPDPLLSNILLWEYKMTNMTSFRTRTMSVTRKHE